MGGMGRSLSPCHFWRCLRTPFTEEVVSEWFMMLGRALVGPMRRGLWDKDMHRLKQRKIQVWERAVSLTVWDVNGVHLVGHQSEVLGSHNKQ